MAMQKAHSSIPWVDYPKLDTPLNAQNLLKEDTAIDVIDDRVISLDTTKFDKTEAQGLFKDVELDPKTGIITFTTYSGAKKTIDTLLEKIAINFDFDEETQKIIITLEDGTTKEVDLKSFITEYEFLDSETIAFTVDTAGKVKAIVKEGSIQEKHLRPDYLADIRVESAKAEAARTGAETAQVEAQKSQTAAATSATQSATSAKESADSATAAAGSASTATAQATSASNSAQAAKTSETNAATSATNAASSAATATSQATSASTSASTATTQANAAKTSATNAATSATKAQSYAEGGTGTRTGEDTDNAKYYYEQSKSISESFSGALRPMGTVTFANLPTLSSVAGGNMYNISDDFTTTADFKEGAGHPYPAGTNVYKTADGKWDCLAGTPVSGVKGDSETSYRRGNVNISKANIGLENVGNFKAVSTVANQGLSATEQSNARANIGITVVNNTADSAKRVAYAASSGTAEHIQAIDDRDVKPVYVTKRCLSAYFTSTSGLNGSQGIDYIDLIALNTWSDNAGGSVNALAFDKKAMNIKHYQAAINAGTWGTPKTLAYTDSTVANATYATSAGSASTATSATNATNATNATYANYVRDYCDTSTVIKIGYHGANLTSSQANYFAMYSLENNQPIIKTTEPSVAKAVLGLGNVNNTADSVKNVAYAASAGSATTADTATNSTKWGNYSIWVGTKAQYNAIASKNANTVYFVTS